MSTNKAILRKTLLSVGLSENEANTYLEALPMGKTTAIKLASATGIKRTTLYSIIDSLVHKGLMKIVHIGWKRYFEAENPEKIQQIVEDNSRNIKDQLPNLLNLYRVPDEEQNIKLFEGIEGYKNALDLMLSDIQPGDFYYIMAKVDKVYEFLPTFFPKFLERRSKQPISRKCIFQDGPRAREYQSHQEIYNDQVHVLTKGVDLKANVVISNHRAVFFKMEPPGAVVIENNQIINTQKQLFEMIWDSLTPKTKQ